PVNNARFSEHASFTLTASATDSDGVIVKVEFLQGGTVLGDDLTAPYTFDVATGLSLGAYTFTARVTDDSGLTGTSAPVNVTVTGSSYSGPPVAAIVAPVDDTRVTGPVVVTGIVAHPTLSS